MPQELQREHINIAAPKENSDTLVAKALSSARRYIGLRETDCVYCIDIYIYGINIYGTYVQTYVRFLCVGCALRIVINCPHRERLGW